MSSSTLPRPLHATLERLGVSEHTAPTFAQWSETLRALSLAWGDEAEGVPDLHVLEASLRTPSEHAADATEVELQHAIALVRATQEASPDGVLVIDDTFAIAGHNHRFLELWGIDAPVLEMSERELVQTLSQRLMDPARALSQLKALRENPTASFSDELALADGRTFEWQSAPIRDGARVFGRVWFVRDVTELKRNQAKLRASAEQLEERVSERTNELETTKAILETNLRRLASTQRELEAVVASTPIGMLTVSDGEVRWSNAACERILGVGPGELVGGPPPVVTECMRGESKVPTRGRVYDVKRPDQQRRWVSVSCSPMPDVATGKTSILMLLEDVTERKQMESQLQAADRMASVGTLAAGVGHEINNPLAYVLANLLFLERELPKMLEAGTSKASAAEVMEVLGEMRQGGERVRDIVRELKAFSRQDDGPRGPVDLQRTIQSAINMTKVEIRHRAQLEQHCNVAMPPVLGVESKLSQVFLNLLLNAAQAIAPGAAERNKVSIRCTRVGETAVVEVSDTGGGIAPEHLGRIFDPFFTTKPVGQGTGLGLAICQGIVQAAGGDIQVESTVGVGTTFRVMLPFSKGGEAPEVVEVTPLPKRTGVLAARVLFIDDEATLFTAVQRVLGPSVTMVQATGAKAALALLEAGKTFDLVLCDLMMPEMTGMDLYQRVQAKFPVVASRMVFMTGGAFVPEVESFLETVPNRCLHKPLDFQQVRAEIDRAVLGQRTR